MNLAETILARTDTGSPLAMKRGKVTQTSPLLVRIDGADTASSAVKLTSYTATLNDIVVLLVAGAERIVIGKVG